MSQWETLKLGRVAAGVGVSLLVDALGDLSGRSLPFRAADVAQPEILAGLISRGALTQVTPTVSIKEVKRQEIPSVSSNCHNLVLTIEQQGESALPDSLFVKLPMESLATRVFMNVIRSWRLESHFFRHVASGLPLRTPITYATAWQGSRFFLVQENLHEDPGVHLFTNPDMMAGPSEQQVLACLDTFARLHACHCGMERSDQEQILPLDYHPFLSPVLGAVSRNLNRLALRPCMIKRPGYIPEDIARSYRRTLRHWDALLQHWFSGPLSLLHGDSHLGNFFVTGEEMGMLDWQAAHWGKGVRDVQYFLIDSVPAQILAVQERQWVDYYIERRAHYGAAVDTEQTWQDYRSFTFHTLMTIVVSIGFGALSREQDTLMAEILSRAVAAVQRVDYPGWLDEFLS
ncbi:MAG: phosphotransferase [Halioglobus sp.]|nr:phosphotransferase [Halioglobus sp.]